MVSLPCLGRDRCPAVYSREWGDSRDTEQGLDKYVFGDQALDNTSCHDSRYPYTVASQLQYGVFGVLGKSQRPSSEQRPQQNSMDHTREGLGGQAWKHPLFCKSA